MSDGTQVERIRALLVQRPGLNDDEVATALDIKPRQTVNGICRRLAEKGELVRERGASGKIVNRLSFNPPSTIKIQSPRTVVIAPTGSNLIPNDLARTLIIIPCSGKKRSGETSGLAGDSFINYLPTELAKELQSAREAVSSRISFDETSRIPAWQRYDGALYRCARRAIENLIEAGAHVVILSGGYGVVLATEPIGTYDTPLKPAWWPRLILERALVTYAKRHSLVSVRAFASETSAYRQVLQRISWSAEGIEDALLLSPQPKPGGMLKSPACLGEAIAALSDSSLTFEWRSSYGLRLNVLRPPSSD